METKKFNGRRKEIDSLLPYMTDAQLAEVAKLALSHMTSQAIVPDEVWGFFDSLTDTDPELDK